MRQYHKVRQLRITDEILLNYFRAGEGLLLLNLPADAKIVRVYQLPDIIGIFIIVFESEEFQPIESGSIIPFLNFRVNDQTTRESISNLYDNTW